jgi:hypothetical protein
VEVMTTQTYDSRRKSKGLTVITLEMHIADRERLKARLQAQSFSDYLRGLINDDLEACGEPAVAMTTRTYLVRRKKGDT